MEVDRERWPRVLQWGTLAVLAYGVLLRFVFPTADPLHATWMGWIVDEGRWTELAREWTLFGAPDLDTAVSRMHLLIAPVYQILSATTFELFGVSLASARLISRVTGSAIVILVALGARRSLTVPGWSAVVALVALDPELIYFSRVSIPEMAALCFHTGAFFLLVRTPRTGKRAILAGLLTALGVGTKATTAPVVLPFLAIAWFVRRMKDPASAATRTRGVILALAAPAVLALISALLLVPDLAYGNLIAGDGGIRDIIAFLRPASPALVIYRLFYSPEAGTLMLPLALLWPLVIGVWVRGVSETEAGLMFRASLIWLLGWLVPWLSQTYFPERYVVHMHVAIAIVIGASMTLLTASGPVSFAEAFARRASWHRLLLASGAALPLAVVLAPLSGALLAQVGLPADRLRVILPVVAVLALATGAALTAARRDPLGVPVVLFPVVAAFTWRLLHGPLTGTYWQLREAGALVSQLWWLGVALLVTLATAALRTRIPERAHATFWAAAGMSAMAVVFTIANVAPALTPPSYVLSDVAGALTSRYEVTTVVDVELATSALIATPFRYHERFGSSSRHNMVFVELSSDTLRNDYALNGQQLVRAFPVPPLRYRGATGWSGVIRLYERQHNQGTVVPDSAQARR